MVYGMKGYWVKVTRMGFRLWLRVKSLIFWISDFEFRIQGLV